ncbi:MAG TPA: hypothetical protein VII02_12885 [Gemmatimonadaceae bacterium]
MTRWPLLLVLLLPSLARSAQAQAEYRNLDAGFPVRVEDATVARFWSLIDSAPASLPSVMPQSAAIAPRFTARYPEAAIIFDNLHSLHDVVSDILAEPSVPRGSKRRTILEAAARYRDSASSITSLEEWKSMAASMGVANMGGPAPVTGGN